MNVKFDFYFDRKKGITHVFSSLLIFFTILKYDFQKIIQLNLEKPEFQIDQ